MRHSIELISVVFFFYYFDVLTGQRRPRKHDLTPQKTLNHWKDPLFQAEGADVVDESQLPLPDDPSAFPVDDGSALHVGNIDEDLTTFASDAVAPAVPEAAVRPSPVVTTASKGTVVQPKGDRPRGPIVREEQLEDKYGTKFTPDAENAVSFTEPEILPNCWLQAMLSNKYDFSPQCNADGTFASKQCYQERCWCVNRDGSPQVRERLDRFYYEIRGLTLRCVQNGIIV